MWGRASAWQEGPFDVRYQDKLVIVTGGTKGIGEGCVHVFAEAGAHVVFCGLEPDLGASVADRVTATGPGTATFTVCDVTRHEDREALIAGTLARHGRLDCLINNAGWHPPHRPIDAFSIDDFRAILELNVVSVFALCKAALPPLRESRGSIVNIASLVATIGQLHATTYVATKGAVLAFTKALAIDEAPHVRVNSVSPGNVFTPLWQEAIDASADPAATRQAGEEAQPFGRMGTPREVGMLCLYLAADATFTTGVDHIIAGGAELGYGKKTR
jgi:NAD(P)-dependent dehydrogenase (short-subunit alcohol dehydrogenase family)